MKLNGALKPHQGVCRAFGHSTGAKKYRDKRCMRRHWVRLQKKYTSNCDNNDTLFVVNNKRRIAQQQPKQEQHEQKLEQPKNSNNIRRSNFNENNNNNNIASKTKTTTCVAQQFQQQQRNAAIVSAREDCSATNAKVAASSWALMSLELLLLQPLMSCCANLVKNIIVVVASVMRVKQSLVPKSSCTPKMLRSAAAAVGGLSGPVGTAAMAFGQLKKCHRQPDSSFVYDPTKVSTLVLCLFYAITILPNPVVCDDGDNFFAVNSFSMGPEPTPPEFDYASRGQKKFGDKCDNTLECGFPGSICDPKKKSCQCTEDLPVTNHIDKCGKEAAVNESCFFNEQCEVKYFQTECRDGRCVCRFEMTPIWGKDGSIECKGRQEKRGPETYIDPAMIGVLVGMALMFVIICVVLRLFSQARWRENRTIFNTPNPRLMNVSLLRDSKLLHGQERRGSRMSVRAPSRQPSMASLRPHSPNPSLGKTGSNSHSGSNASATSLRSNRSNSVAPGNAVNSHHERKGSAHHQQHLNQQQHEAHQHHHHHHPQQQQHEPLMTNITANPADENVTVEIIVPEKK